MVPQLFWDVDTQYDFMMPDGKLYVAGAEEIIPNLSQLTRFAREHRIPIWGSVDYHNPDDPEISDQPDFLKTFPLHCVKDTPGQQKIEATSPLNPLWIDSHLLEVQELHELLNSHQGEVIFRKQRFDVFTNPNVIPALNFLGPQHIFVYGVALDVCDFYAVEGFLKMNRFQLTLIEDATKPIHPDQAGKLLEKWQKQGVRIAKTEEIVRE
ncbi:hypothetical protein B1H10_04750 [candidate division KSB1 bacterium 4484_188]|nr:MAG: hypothetical protein B1H10_04750 [candidate division KSB1 bacterium 4484_188]